MLCWAPSLHREMGKQGPRSHVAVSQMAEALPCSSSQTKPLKSFLFSSLLIVLDLLIRNEQSVYLPISLTSIYLHPRLSVMTLWRLHGALLSEQRCCRESNLSCCGGGLIVAASCGTYQIRIWIELRGEAQ